MKRSLLMVLVIIMICGIVFQAPVLADSSLPNEGEASPDLTQGWIHRTKGEISLLNDDLIWSWGNGIKVVNASTGYIYVDGFTYTYSSVDYLSLRLYVQIWDSSTSTWVNWRSFFYTKYNSWYIDEGTHTTVVLNKYVRVRSIHYASHGLLDEMQVLISPYVYVG